ncbi:hypothetical protein HK102_006044 [Quaeritorhiza haematococci]|nr:hypothetical protein HK102_006044 [Quaeritorhiza haematococci]
MTVMFRRRAVKKRKLAASTDQSNWPGSRGSRRHKSLRRINDTTSSSTGLSSGDGTGSLDVDDELGMDMSPQPPSTPLSARDEPQLSPTPVFLRPPGSKNPFRIPTPDQVSLDMSDVVNSVGNVEQSDLPRPSPELPRPSPELPRPLSFAAINHPHAANTDHVPQRAVADQPSQSLPRSIRTVDEVVIVGEENRSASIHGLFIDGGGVGDLSYSPPPSAANIATNSRFLSLYSEQGTATRFIEQIRNANHYSTISSSQSEVPSEQYRASGDYGNPDDPPSYTEGSNIDGGLTSPTTTDGLGRSWGRHQSLYSDVGGLR